MTDEYDIAWPCLGSNELLDLCFDMINLALERENRARLLLIEVGKRGGSDICSGDLCQASQEFSIVVDTAWVARYEPDVSHGQV